MIEKSDKEHTNKDMEDFLNDIGGLKNGYNGDTITDPRFFEVDIGWYPLIKDLIINLIATGWNKEVCQIKEKFGGLRFYPGITSDLAWDLIQGAENESYKICERCGKEGKIRNSKWLKCLCDDCWEEAIK